jgi:tripartite-type tricarboxylate transporter receptor subunit TctC
MVVINKEGASGTLALSELKNQVPDGYNIGFLSTGQVISAHVQKLPFDPLKDFEPIIEYVTTSYGILVKPDSPFKTLEDLIAYARANPGKLKAGTLGTYTPQNLVLTQLGEAAKVKWVMVPFGGGMAIISAVMGGHLDFSLQAGEWKPFVLSDRLRLLATFNEKRLKEFPNVPTLVDLGYNIVGLCLWSVVGPRGIPKDRVQILHDVLYQGLQEPGFAEVAKKWGLEIAYRDPRGLQKHIEEIYEKSGEIIKKLEKK